MIRKLDVTASSLALLFFHLLDMDNETDNTAVDIVDFLESPKPLSQQPPQSTEQDRTLEEILAQPSTDLIHTFAASISQSAIKETSKTEKFRQGICECNAHICRFLLTTRPKLRCRIQKTPISGNHCDVRMVDGPPRA